MLRCYAWSCKSFLLSWGPYLVYGQLLHFSLRTRCTYSRLSYGVSWMFGTCCPVLDLVLLINIITSSLLLSTLQQVISKCSDLFWYKSISNW